MVTRTLAVLSALFVLAPFVLAENRDQTVTKVVCFGDSITKRGYPDILGPMLGIETINAGVAGHTSGQGLRRMEKDVLSRDPDAVVVFFGTNDIRVDHKVHVPLPKYKENLTEIIRACQKGGAKVVLCTAPPIREKAYFTRHEKKVFDDAGGLEKLLSDYREVVRELGKQYELPVVDLAELLKDDATWMHSDGVHPSDAGNAAIAKHVARALRPLLEKKSGASIKNNTADIVVYGATSAGLTAAVQAARMNKSVILLEPSTHLGGLTTGGLGATDIGNKDVIGGISREFYQRVAQHYAKDSSWKWETREHFFKNRSKRTKLKEVSGPDATMWTFEPHVASKIFEELLAEVGVVVRFEQKLTAVVKEQGRIKEISMLGGADYRARMFIDATYEGDLMAKAGVSYTVGREANAKYGEEANGIRAKTPKNQVTGSIDPYVVPGDPSSGLIPLIQEGDGGTPGEGDHRVQAYNFRLCFTNEAENRLPLAAPENYDSGQYELAARRVEKIVAAGADPVMKQFCNPVWMPNGKTDINNSQGISTDFIGANYEYPDAGYDQRAEIWKAHEDYVKGFWYFMSTSPRVPEKLRKDFLSFGPCKDEYIDNDFWSPQLYVREARRMVSSYVMTEANCRSKEVVKDSVGMAAYGMDSHNCQRIVKNGMARNEGDVQIHGLKPYPIAYRSIVPIAEECENLLVPVCVSASHIAFGSIRMEPVFMVLGQSAAVAASMSIDEDLSVQDLAYSDLRAQLLAASQVLERPKKKK